MSTSETGPEGNLAWRLNFLFSKIKPTPQELARGEEPGREYTNREIAEKVRVDGDHYPQASISAQYIGELRRGVTTNPRVSQCQALARAFGVNPAYLFDDDVARQVQSEVDLLRQLRVSGVRTVALRTVLGEQGLDEDQIPLVQALIAQLAQKRDGTTGSGPALP